MKHNYTDEEIKTAWKDSLSLRAFLDALPERPQAQPGPWPGQQEAIDAAFDDCGEPWVSSDSSSPLWLHEAPDRLAIAQAYDAARPQAAEIASLKEALLQAQEAAKDLLAQRDKAQAELAKWHAELSAVMPADFKDWHENAQAEWPFVAAQVIRNLRAREKSALEMAEKAQAELAALRTPIQSDAGIRLGQVAFEAFCPGNTRSYRNYLKVPWEAAAQAVAAVVEARMIQRMEAVPVEELGAINISTPGGFKESARAVRARLIAAVKGEGQAEAKPSTRVEITEIPDKQPGPVGTLVYAQPPVVVNEPPQDEKQPDLSGESEKPAWIAHDGGPCPLKDEEVEEWQVKWRDGHVDTYKNLNPSQADGWDGCIIAYRVLRWKPGHGPEAKAEPATKEAPATFDPYARLKAYNEAGAKIRSYSVMKGEWSEWRINVPWVWCLPFNFYEVHPDDLHMVPEYAPKAETHAKKGAELMGKAMKFEAQPWTLPAPPPGRRWHRNDWTADMLPEGYRPLLNGEAWVKGDQVRRGKSWDTAGEYKWDLLNSLTCSETNHCRTRRPLPAEASAEPEQAAEEKPCGLNSALDEWSADDGPPWIPHDGGPCPLKDEEVEEWEYKTRNGALMTGVKAWKPSLRRWKHISDTDDIIAYRVLRWKPGHGPQAAKPDPAPATFEAHGKTWTRHTPGDPCPCDPEAKVEVLFEDGGEADCEQAAGDWSWKKHGQTDSIIGWRYADEPSQAKAIPTEPEDKRLPPLNEADPVGHCAVEAACVHRKLDELGIPREEGGNELSLWGRVEEYAKAQPTQLQQAWTPAVGDTVRLKSGGPVMTVYDIAKDKSFICCVHNTKGLCDYTTLPASCLTPAKP